MEDGAGVFESRYFWEGKQRSLFGRGVWLASAVEVHSEDFYKWRLQWLLLGTYLCGSLGRWLQGFWQRGIEGIDHYGLVEFGLSLNLGIIDWALNDRRWKAHC